MKQIGWGFIGCGEVTEKKSGPAFNEVEGSHVVAVMSRNEAKAKSYAKRHGIKRWYTTLKNLSTIRMLQPYILQLLRQAMPLLP